MALIQIEMTEEETALVDRVAEKEKRSRKAQFYVLALSGLAIAERSTSKLSPRWFTNGISSWKWDGVGMVIDGEDSIFKNPADLIDSVDGIYEVNEYGEPICATEQDIAAGKADRDRDM
jgi:hypothetical protein